MPHKFMESPDNVIAGTWFKYNGRRYCAWKFDPASRRLSANRGEVVRSITLAPTATSLEVLRDKLPRLALELASRDSAA